MSMITATAWVPRGYTAAFPTKYVFDEDEYGRIAKLAKLQLEDAEEDLEEAQAEEKGETKTAKKEDKLEQDTDEIDNDLKEYNLEDYDADETEEQGTAMGMFENIKSLAYHESNEDDPYITLKGEDEDDEEREDLQVLQTDNLLLAARIEDEIAHLEVYVYEDDADNLYVHHDIMLPAYPLCVEWLNSRVGAGNESGADGANYVAIGTMDPDIEIWDLDTIDCMYPNAILGPGADAEPASQGKKKKKKGKKLNDNYHVDSVLSLAANKHHRNLLVSSSADTTVKLWDLHTAKCAKSYSLHSDKVCSTSWHTTEPTVLLTGSYDRTAVVSDMRTPGADVPRWSVESDVETVKWDPHKPEIFYITTENGIIHCHDVRSTPDAKGASKAVWTLQAHDESISSFDINPIIPGFFVTGSTDKEIKIWNVQPSGPSMVVSRNLDVGKVFTTTFAPDKEVGFRLAVAGSKGTVQIWDTSTNAAVRRIFGDRIAPTNGAAGEDRLVKPQESDDESESGDDEEGEGEEDSDEDEEMED